MRPDSCGNLAGSHIGIDIVGCSISANSNTGDDRDIVTGDEIVQQCRVNLGDVARQTKLCADRLGLDSVTIGTGKPHGQMSVRVHLAHQLLVDLTNQDHFDHIHDFWRGHAHTVLEFYRQAKSLAELTDLVTTTVDDDRVEADDLHQHDVTHDIGTELVISHCGTAIFDHDGLTGGFFYPRQSLDEQLRLLQ